MLTKLITFIVKLCLSEDKSGPVEARALGVAKLLCAIFHSVLRYVPIYNRVAHHGSSEQVTFTANTDTSLICYSDLFFLWTVLQWGLYSL
jgi:hypothetical protein